MEVSFGRSEEKPKKLEVGDIVFNKTNSCFYLVVNNQCEESFYLQSTKGFIAFGRYNTLKELERFVYNHTIQQLEVYPAKRYELKLVEKVVD